MRGAEAGMATSEERLEQMNVAMVLCAMQREVRSRAKGTMGWGVFCLVIGAVQLAAQNWLGVGVNAGFGALLMGAGLYELRSSDPKVMKVSSATPGLVAAWNLGIFTLGMALHSAHPGGAPLAGVFQAVGAYNLWKQYAVYAELYRKADAATVVEMKQRLEEMKAAKDAIEFRVRATLKDEQFWRVRFVDDLALMTRITGQVFGMGGNIAEAAWVRRSDLRVETQGEKWMGKELKATLHVGAGKMEKVEILPEILERLGGRV
jgi:hypothetical protein